MAPFYQRPENALKRAEELIAVGQNAAALTSLHEIIISKRSRNQQPTALEPIMLLFVKLCVDLRKGKVVKEGLLQYKNISQNSNVPTIELVIKKFIELSEEKVTAAQAKADKIALDVDDLEASETPESIMLSTVSGEQSKDRTDRAVVTPWLRFLWDAYRTVLDILRNNARLEILYQEIAHQAFQFCLKYSRKTEFRRLCDLLRNHLQNISKYAHQPHAINLNEPETLQRHLDTRFSQLNAAVELELWQEAFRSVEDIHNLLSMSKRLHKPVMMANYYDKLTKIFLVSGNYLFHAAAWNKYYTLVKMQNKSLTDEENTRMASFVLLSALAIPVITSSKTRALIELDDTKSKHHRLAVLLGMSRAPMRTGLLKEALNKNILRRVRPELRELYNILEVQFHPLSICKKIEPIMAQLAQDKEMVKYVKPLHQVILTRLFQQLSQVYDTVKLDFVVNLASFPAPYKYDAAAIEKFIMNGCKKGELSIRIDHTTSSLTFETDLFSAPKNSEADGVKLQSSPADRMRDHLSKLAKCFHATVHMIDPSIVEDKEEAKRQALQRALAGMTEEHNKALARKAIIERRKKLVETLLVRKEKEEQREKSLRQKQMEEDAQKRAIEEALKRERERRQRELEAIQKEEAKKLAESLRNKNLKVEAKDLETLDTEKLVQLQVEQLEKEKRELNERLRATAKRMDHLERAYRKEEIPLLEKDYERQKKADKALHEAARQVQLQTARAKHTSDLKIKERLSRMLSDYHNYRAEIENKRFEEFEQQLERQRQEELERRRKLDEVVAIQRQREEAAEQKRLAREKDSAGAYVPPNRRRPTETPWRRNTEEVKATPAKDAPTHSGKEVRRPLRTEDSEPPRTDKKPWRRSDAKPDQMSEWRRLDPGNVSKRVGEEQRKRQDSEDGGRGPPRILRTGSGSESGWRAREAAKKAASNEADGEGRDREDHQHADEPAQADDDGFTLIKRRKK
ncbi:7774_t:CDS:2 [Paraglomus occultum]|uniref:Eukaryotic translation initiation factor 3 subunit A n=1 Tax=Paraglomus occultum TaxID=144539 RepID=A0A9N9CKP0_9GLOM|nr:7774_t:CDS:2 [Paraglomus occultum]